MNIQQLEYLLAVDKYKHFGKAAQACFITQPTLSAMIQKLEEELDVKIFDRSSHPIRTTDVGTKIIENAQEIINSVNNLRYTASSLNNVISGKLKIGIITTVSSFILPDEIFEFLKINPKIQFEIKEMTTKNIIKSLKSNEIDLGIISTPLDAAAEFYHDVVFNEELMLYCSENFSAKDKFIAPTSISTDKVWLLEEDNCLRTQFENICHLKENTLKPKNMEIVASNINTLIQLVDKIGGISILPELAITQLSEEQKNKIYRFRKPYPYREISLIYYKPTYKQKIIDEFSSFIKNSLKNKLNYYKSPNDYTNVKPQ